MITDTYSMERGPVLLNLNSKLYLLLVLPIISLLFASKVFSESLPHTLKIVTGEWAPYISKEYANNGHLAELLTEIYAPHNIELEFIFLPWTDGYQGILDGKYDLAMPYYCSPKRASQSICSDPVISGEMVFFYRKDSPFNWSSYDNLKTLTIGANYGYYYGEELSLLEESSQIVVKRSVTDDTSMMALMRGKIDLYPQDKAVGYALIHKLFPKNEQNRITHHELPLNSDSLHVLFSKNNPSSLHLVSILNDGIAKIKSSGRLDGILINTKP